MRSRPHTCVLAGGSAPGAAVADGRGTLEECARTLDANPGCNYLVATLCIFFWRGDMPHYSPPLPFSAGRAGCPARGSRSCMLADVHAGRRACARARHGGCEWLRLSVRPRTHLAVTAPRFLPLCAPVLAEFFSVLPSEKNRSSNNVQKGQNFLVLP